MTTADMNGVVWSRRRHAFTSAARTFATDRAGLVGLVILVVIVALALLAPVLTDPAGLDVTKAAEARLAAPGAQYFAMTLPSWWLTLKIMLLSAESIHITSLSSMVSPLGPFIPGISNSRITLPSA